MFTNSSYLADNTVDSHCEAGLREGTSDPTEIHPASPIEPIILPSQSTVTFSDTSVLNLLATVAQQQPTVNHTVNSEDVPSSSRNLTLQERLNMLLDAEASAQEDHNSEEGNYAIRNEGGQSSADHDYASEDDEIFVEKVVPATNTRKRKFSENEADRHQREANRRFDRLTDFFQNSRKLIVDLIATRLAERPRAPSCLTYVVGHRLFTDGFKTQERFSFDAVRSDQRIEDQAHEFLDEVEEVDLTEEDEIQNDEEIEQEEAEEETEDAEAGERMTEEDLDDDEKEDEHEKEQLQEEQIDKKDNKDTEEDNAQSYVSHDEYLEKLLLDGPVEEANHQLDELDEDELLGS